VKAWSRLGCGNIILPLSDFKNHVTACTERAGECRQAHP